MALTTMKICSFDLKGCVFFMVEGSRGCRPVGIYDRDAVPSRLTPSSTGSFQASGLIPIN